MDEEKIPKEVKLFFKECRVAGYNIWPHPDSGFFGYVENGPYNWALLGLTKPPGNYRLVSPDHYAHYETLDELIEAAYEQIREM